MTLIEHLQAKGYARFEGELFYPIYYPMEDSDVDLMEQANAALREHIASLLAKHNAVRLARLARTNPEYVGAAAIRLLAPKEDWQLEAEVLSSGLAPKLDAKLLRPEVPAHLAPKDKKPRHQKAA